MAQINLTGQSVLANQIGARIQDLRDTMDLRAEIWQRIDRDKKIAWIRSGKDPIMSLAWTIFKYLYNNFFRDLRKVIDNVDP